MFNASRLRIFDPDKIAEITLTEQSQQIAERILPQVSDHLAQSHDDPLVAAQQIVRHCLPRFKSNGWTEERFIDVLCIWEVLYGPDFETAPEFARVPRFYVRAHETQNDVFADMMITLRAAEAL